MRHAALPLLLVLVAGCSSTVKPHEHVETPPEAKEVALAQYRSAVLGVLPTPATARFSGQPIVVSGRDPDTKEVTVVAMGYVDAENEYGALLRYMYDVEWMKRRDGWVVSNARVSPAP